MLLHPSRVTPAAQPLSPRPVSTRPRCVHFIPAPIPRIFRILGKTLRILRTQRVSQRRCRAEERRRGRKEEERGKEGEKQTNKQNKLGRQPTGSWPSVPPTDRPPLLPLPAETIFERSAGINPSKTDGRGEVSSRGGGGEGGGPDPPPQHTRTHTHTFRGAPETLNKNANC